MCAVVLTATSGATGETACAIPMTHAVSELVPEDPDQTTVKIVIIPFIMWGMPSPSSGKKQVAP